MHSLSPEIGSCLVGASEMRHEPGTPRRFTTEIIVAPGLSSAPPRPCTPLHALWLAAECVGLKAQNAALQAAVADLYEQLDAARAQHVTDAAKIASLLCQKQDLTRAVHRTACAG